MLSGGCDHLRQYKPRFPQFSSVFLSLAAMAPPRSAKKPKGLAGKGRPLAPSPPVELLDDVEKFHRQRDGKLALNMDEDEVSDDSLDANEVLGLDDSDEFDTDDEIEAETKYGKSEWHAAWLGGA